MYCKNCGHQLEDDNAKFCPNCGQPLEGNTSESKEPSRQREPKEMNEEWDRHQPNNSQAHLSGSFLQNRSVTSVILLSIFTCGIYSIFWFYTTADDLNNADHTEEPLMNYILAILLGIVTLGIYQIYWLYKFFKKLDVVTGEQNLVLNLLMTFLFSSIVSSAIAQSSINKIAN